MFKTHNGQMHAASTVVVLYWRALKANEKVELPVSLVAAVPGTYTGPASRAYLYYTDEFKTWTDGVKVEISPSPASELFSLGGQSSGMASMEQAGGPDLNSAGARTASWGFRAV